MAGITIEISRPELEALIRERMNAGAVQRVEDALIQALTNSPPDAASAMKHTSADLIAAIQRSPYRELEIEPKRYRMPVGDVAL